MKRAASRRAGHECPYTLSVVEGRGRGQGGHEVPQVVKPEAAHTGTAQVTDKRFGDPSPADHGRRTVALRR